MAVRMRRRHVLKNQKRAPVQPASIFIALLFSAIAVPAVMQGALAQSEQTDPGDEEVIRSGPVQPAEDPNKPRRHFRVEDPAKLGPERAEAVYRKLKGDMAGRYRVSHIQKIERYQNWQRYNTAPYRSASHGRRYINNYANDTARAYGKWEQSGPLPVGSIIAKDSFTVTDSGTVMPGPLFVMEKMPDGFSPVSGNWRYTMIMPDGSLFGVTNGTGSERVTFCISCHLAVEKQDHLFYIPAAYRNR